MKILGICGSLQRQSGNLALLNLAAASTPPGVEVVLFDGLRELPHFDPDTEASGAPESVMRWRRALSETDAILIATPEYGFSLPLKNGIDWVIGSGELEGKVVAITAAVPAPARGRRGLQALRDTLSAVRATNRRRGTDSERAGARPSGGGTRGNSDRSGREPNRSFDVA
jgi:NAD(P)H-dependent FMN reductase